MKHILIPCATPFIKPVVFSMQKLGDHLNLLTKKTVFKLPLKRFYSSFWVVLRDEFRPKKSLSLDTYAKMGLIGLVRIFYASYSFTHTAFAQSKQRKNSCGGVYFPKLEYLL
ncbi:MAG: hypothetical protein VX278_22685 [Myxococcota bacterium]|nr:hypothetical protein [Myxococcota bacterium]